MRHFRYYTGIVILVTMMFGMSGCGNESIDAPAEALSAEKDISQEAEQKAAAQESAAASVEETTTENITEEESAGYQIDRSGIPDDANVQAMNLTTNTAVTYGEVLDYVEQQGGTGLADVRDYCLNLPQILDLTERYQDGELVWELDVDGVQISPDVHELDFSGHDLAALDLDMYTLLGLLPDLEKIDMCQCGFSNDEMAALQDAFPEIKIVWEIVLSHWTIRTDAVAFSTMKTCAQTFYLNDDEAKYLKYCTDLVALDLGHNYVTDLSFLQFMPELKILILVDNVKGWENGKIRRIDDLSMLQYVPKLEYLEFFCNRVQDISFLQYTPNLVDLNISYNPVSDASYLFELPKLERLFLEHTKIPYSEFERLQETYPNAQLEYYGEGSIDHDWRKHERYYAMRDMFKNNYVHPLFAD
ncbi:MAG: leucine-rich repeat domain-containing protein [Lachnospiraceae bacterium]|nr:leucine-rich repeat domain-containing protein [Lachnospiraceae bacterium]